MAIFVVCRANVLLFAFRIRQDGNQTLLSKLDGVTGPKAARSMVKAVGGSGQPFLYSSYVDHPLVMGAGYEPEDIKVLQDWGDIIASASQ